MNVIDIAGLPPVRRQGLVLSPPVSPRPIAMITEPAQAGWADLAPYRHHRPIGERPPLITVPVDAQRQNTPESKGVWPTRERICGCVAHGETAEIAEDTEAVGRGLPPRPTAQPR